MGFFRRFALFAVGVGLGVGTSVSAATAKDVPPIDLTPVIEPVRERFRAPAVAAAATQHGRLIATGAVGVRDLDARQPVALTDRSLIGSCGKSLTRLLIGRLVDKGLIRWDTTLAESLPDVPMREEYRAVIIADVIAHRGGLRPYTRISPRDTPILFQQGGTANERRAAFMTHLLNEPPAVPPRTRYHYSNAGYGLLGHIAERHAGVPFEELIRDEVFQPLAMNSAIVGAPRSAPAVTGWSGHVPTPEGFRPVPQERPGLPAIAPAGNMSCSIEDFARMASELVRIESGTSNNFLSASTASKLTELRPNEGGEGEIFYGGDGHFTAAFAIWPSSGLAVVVQTNAGDSDELCEALLYAVRTAVALESGHIQSPEEQARRGKYGFRIDIRAGDEETWTVRDVVPDSPAAAAGLARGDRILAINARPLNTIPVDERMAVLQHSPVKLTIDRAGKSMEVTMAVP